MTPRADASHGAPPPQARPRIYVYAWANNERRAELHGRRCIVIARGAMGTVLVEFLDSRERVSTSVRALRVLAPAPSDGG